MNGLSELPAGRGVDAIELEVFRHLFASIAEEMGERLMRSAYSPNIKERRDFSCALFDARGELLAQAAHIPVHLGAMQPGLAAVLAEFPPELMSPGQRFIANDPYRGGTHLPDIAVCAPVFTGGGEDGPPAFYVANRAHHSDVGGISSGSMALARHIDDEGIRIAPALLTDAQFEAVCAASRTPQERRGDLSAQLAALDAGRERLLELCAAYGANHLAVVGAALQDYAARIMAQVIADIPPGEYSFCDVLDDDGLDTSDIRICCNLTAGGGKLKFDFSGSDPQCAGPLNAVRAVTMSAVAYCLRCLAPPDTPANSGIMRDVEVITRSGSIVDAQYPAPVAAGNVETSQRISDVVLGTLAAVLPGRIPAASQGTMNNLAIGGVDPRTGEAFTYYETIAGGAGAGPSGPGESAVHTHMTNTLNTPVEALEHACPLLVEEYAIRETVGRASAPAIGDESRAYQPAPPLVYFGGDGIIRRIRLLCDAEVTLLTERRVHAPWGITVLQASVLATSDESRAQQLAPPGQTGINRLIHADGTVEELPGKCTLRLRAGDAVEILTPGGGGWSKATDSQTS